MIILDTNVVSEPMRPSADAAVIAWLDGQDAADLYLTSISLAELLVGLQMMPEGRRRANLTVRLDGLLTRLFGIRILPFDMPAARAYAQLAAGSRSRGRMVGLADGQIAAIAFSRIHCGDVRYRAVPSHGRSGHRSLVGIRVRGRAAV